MKVDKVKNFLFLPKVKWRSSIKRIKARKILKAVPEGTKKVIPKNLKIKNPVPREETISLN